MSSDSLDEVTKSEAHAAIDSIVRPFDDGEVLYRNFFGSYHGLAQAIIIEIVALFKARLTIPRILHELKYGISGEDFRMFATRYPNTTIDDIYSLLHYLVATWDNEDGTWRRLRWKIKRHADRWEIACLLKEVKQITLWEPPKIEKQRPITEEPSATAHDEHQSQG